MNYEQLVNIRGQYTAKRALEIAEVGNNSVLLIGPLGSGKSILLQAFGNERALEVNTCPCGHFMDVRRRCVCSKQQILRWYRRFERIAADYDIVLEISPVPTKEMLWCTQSSEPSDIQTRVTNAQEFGKINTSLELKEDSAIRIMEMATRRLGITYGQYQRIIRVARAIANLDGSPGLRGKHVAEAVQYRADAFTFSQDRILEYFEKGLA